MKAYNQKIIETPTYIEIYDYETTITSKRKRQITNQEIEQNRNKEWIIKLNKKNKFDELSAQGQLDSLKRKQKYYKNMRFEIARLIDTNYDNSTKFLTLTFMENIEDIEYANYEFKKFIKRLNYELYKTKKAQIKYLATWEKQGRGAIHYHIILFDFPYISNDKLSDIWRHGFIKINMIDVDSVENRGRYISKYFDKDLDLKEHKKKAFFRSQNLKQPIVIKQLTDTPFDLTNQDVLYTKEYVINRPVSYNGLTADGNFEQMLEFQDSTIRYTKIRRHQC